ncbi:type II toxin-antitoxin system RatA family toxin [Fretibacter rubidus]|uniref:type II toxin-antitoxin system RatA family toxin n=1 Tax=Fretibacter rubidus TaxID=570162 RepID=UPI00352B7016
MPQAALLQRVPHAPDDVLAMVADVERYPDFISLISAARITKRLAAGEGLQKFEADAVVAYKFISETFGSLVSVDHKARTISVTKSNRGGAVKSLRNDWVFHPLSDGSTLVDFDVDVRLKAFPLEMLAREKFDKAAAKIMGYFIDHARETLPIVGQDGLNMPAEVRQLGLPLTRLI